MRPESASDSDALLHQTLSEWRVRETLPPRFGERVWQRIEREEAGGPQTLWGQLMSRIGAAMLRPSLAVGYVTVLLLAGLVAGYWQARADNARVSSELGARYVQMMTPYQTPHH